MAVHTALQDLAELIRYQAAVRPEQVAITFEGRSTTYGQLDRRRMGLPMGCGQSNRRAHPLKRNAVAHCQMSSGHVTGILVHKENRVTALGPRFNCLQVHRDNSNWVLGHNYLS